MKDYLIILAGSPRGGEETWNSMYKYVKEPLNADLAICCSDRWNQDTSLFKKQTMYGHLKKWKIILPNIMKKILMVHGWTILIWEKIQDYILQVQYILYLKI